LPVVATIRDAYAFTFAHLGGIIGLIWVPTLLLTVMGFFSFQRYYNDLVDALAGGNNAALGASVLMMLGYLVALLLLEAVILVSVVQLALGMRDKKPALAHFAFGPLEWRTFRALIGLVGLAALILFPAYMLIGLAGRGAGLNLAILVLYGLMALGAPRFLALLPAVCVAETAPVLPRAWMLSAGNFWRLLAVLAATVLPPVLTVAIVAAALSGPAAPQAAGLGDQAKMLAAVLQARQVLPLVSGLNFLISPLLVGLVSGASVSAWRVLAGERALDVTV
jgi:hypothetical protein